MSKDRPSLVAAIAAALVLTASGAPSEAKPKEQGKSPLAGLEWLVGTWKGEEEGSVSEERWADALGGTMVGTFREVEDGKLGMYEFMALEEDDETVVLRLRHFEPGLVPWSSEKDGPLTMRESERGERKVVFADAAREFPKSIAYAVEGDVLTVRLDGKREGKPMSFDVKMKRVPSR